MPSIIDLDEILGEDKKVKVKGVVYTLPPDLPVETYLAIQKLSQPGTSETEIFETLHPEVLALFRYGKPDLEELPLTLGQLAVLVGRVYGDAADQQQQAQRPPRRSSSGGAKRTGKGTRR